MNEFYKSFIICFLFVLVDYFKKILIHFVLLLYVKLHSPGGFEYFPDLAL